MNLVATNITGAYLIEPTLFRDDRGFFARTYCQDFFSKNGLEINFQQWNISFNLKSGTIRGMHLQLPPHAQTKIVRCTKGKILDVIVDVRPNSPTFKQSFSTILSPETLNSLYVPAGLVHGFQTLEDNSEVNYAVCGQYAPHVESGIRYDDKGLAIDWPLPMTVISEKDLKLPSLQDFLKIQARS